VIPTVSFCPFTNGDRVEVHGLTAAEEYSMHPLANGQRLTVDDTGCIKPHHPGFQCWFIWCKDKRGNTNFLMDRNIRRVA